MCTGTPTHKYGICTCRTDTNPYCLYYNCPKLGLGSNDNCDSDLCTYTANGNYPDNYCTQITPKTAGQMNQGMCNAYFTCEENACKGTAEVDTCACKASNNQNCSVYDCPSVAFKNCNNIGDDSDYCIKLGPDNGDATTSQCNQADPRSCTKVPGCFNAGGFAYASNDVTWPTGFPQ